MDTDEQFAEDARISAIEAKLLDRFAALGVVVELEFEEPEFEDDMPKFDMAMKAANMPLTNRERRDLIGLDPFGDARDDEVWLPAGLAPAYNVQGQPVPMGEDTYTTAYEDPFEDEVSLYAKAVDVPAYVRDAARRGLDYYDGPAVDRITESALKSGNRFSSVVLGVVMSDPFRLRRGTSQIESGSNPSKK